MRRFACAFLCCLAVLFVLADGSAAQKSRSGKRGKSHPGLLDPTKATKKAPDEFKVEFDTTKGKVVIEVKRAWSPNGVDRLYNLVRVGFFTDIAFYRVVEDFMAQFGVHGDPKVNKVWSKAMIKDDPAKQSNKPGYLTYAMSGPNTRTTQFFISYRDNSYLDKMGFTPIGKVVEGMSAVESIYKEYGDMPQQGGKGPDPSKIGKMGNDYLKKNFPKLDYIKSAKIVK